MGISYVVVALLFAAAVYTVIRYFIKASRRFGGARVIICPETSKQSMVEVDTRRAALTSLVGRADLRLENCWRWPLQQNCGQECLLQLDVAEDDCLVRSVLSKWYQGKQCVFCRRKFQEVNLIDHTPALFTPAGITVELSEIPISDVNEAMATYKPVCANCYVAQTFYHERPDLVVERPVM
jgi:hypothetical protein